MADNLCFDRCTSPSNDRFVSFKTIFISAPRICLTLYITSQIMHRSDLKTKCKYNMWRVKRICVFEHSVRANFNCVCPAIQRGLGSGFLFEGSCWFTACMSEQRRLWRMRSLARTFAARIGDKYQIRLTRPIYFFYQMNAIVMSFWDLCIFISGSIGGEAWGNPGWR